MVKRRQEDIDATTKIQLLFTGVSTLSVCDLSQSSRIAEKVQPCLWLNWHINASQLGVTDSQCNKMSHLSLIKAFGTQQLVSALLEMFVVRGNSAVHLTKSNQHKRQAQQRGQGDQLTSTARLSTSTFLWFYDSRETFMQVLMLLLSTGDFIPYTFHSPACFTSNRVNAQFIFPRQNVKKTTPTPHQTNLGLHTR